MLYSKRAKKSLSSETLLSLPIAEAVKSIIEDESEFIATSIVGEAITFVPIRKKLSDEVF